MHERSVDRDFHASRRPSRACSVQVTLSGKFGLNGVRDGLPLTSVPSGTAVRAVNRYRRRHETSLQGKERSARRETRSEHTMTRSISLRDAEGDGWPIPKGSPSEGRGLLHHRPITREIRTRTLTLTLTLTLTDHKRIPTEREDSDHHITWENPKGGGIHPSINPSPRWHRSGIATTTTPGTWLPRWAGLGSSFTCW